MKVMEYRKASKKTVEYKLWINLDSKYFCL